MRTILFALKQTRLKADEVAGTETLRIRHFVAANHVSSGRFLLAEAVFIDCKAAENKLIYSVGISCSKVCHDQRTGMLSDKACFLYAKRIHKINEAVGKVGEFKPLGRCGRETEAEGIGRVYRILLREHGDYALKLKIVPPALMDKYYRITVTHPLIIHLGA